jgi:hypothetical protein
MLLLLYQSPLMTFWVWSGGVRLDPERALSHGLNEIRPVPPLSFFTVPSFCEQVVLVARTAQQ